MHQWIEWNYCLKSEPFEARRCARRREREKLFISHSSLSHKDKNLFLRLFFYFMRIHKIIIYWRANILCVSEHSRSLTQGLYFYLARLRDFSLSDKKACSSLAAANFHFIHLPGVVRFNLRIKTRAAFLSHRRRKILYAAPRFGQGARVGSTAAKLPIFLLIWISAAWLFFRSSSSAPALLCCFMQSINNALCGKRM